MAGLIVLVNPVVPSFQVTEPEQLDTVNVALLPAHIVGLLTVGVGFGVTVTVLVAVPIQFPTLQVAVYVVVEVGLTVLVNPVVPSFHVTELEQLLTVKVAELPEHIVGLFTVGVGFGVTVTVLVAVPVQVPTLQVAVYVVVEIGLTVLVNPVVPSFQVTEPEQFETVKVALLPEHIVGLLTVGVGFGITVTVLVAVPVHVPTLQVAV